MKKLFSMLLGVVLTIALCFSLAGCNKDYEGKIEIYMPDGAPALAFSRLCRQVAAKPFSFFVLYGQSRLHCSHILHIRPFLNGLFLV